MGPRWSGVDPEDSGGLLVFAARRPPAAGRRRSSDHREGSLLPTPLRAAGFPFLQDACTAGSSGRLGRGGGRGGGGSFRRESV
jgi:hypothetical protein